MSDNFWSNNLSILFDKERVVEFYPTSDMTFDEQLNSLMRFGLYFSFIVILYKKNFSYISIFFIIGIITLFAYSYNKQDNILEQMTCTKPTKNNTYMNHILGDPVDKKPACDVRDPKIKSLLDGYAESLNPEKTPFTNFSKSSFNFHYMPALPSAIEWEKTVNWLTNKAPDKTCKSDTNCVPYNDLRSQPQLMVYTDLREQGDRV